MYRFYLLKKKKYVNLCNNEIYARKQNLWNLIDQKMCILSFKYAYSEYYEMTNKVCRCRCVGESHRNGKKLFD